MIYKVMIKIAKNISWPAVGAGFRRRKNKVVYFSFMIFPYPTTSYFSFTTDSELVWAQET